MLKSKPFKDGDTISILLNSGHEIVCVYESMDAEFIYVKSPKAVDLSGEIKLTPLMKTTQDEKYNINLNNIVTIAPTSHDWINTPT